MIETAMIEAAAMTGGGIVTKDDETAIEAAIEDLVSRTMMMTMVPGSEGEIASGETGAAIASITTTMEVRGTTAGARCVVPRNTNARRGAAAMTIAIEAEAGVGASVAENAGGGGGSTDETGEVGVTTTSVPGGARMRIDPNVADSVRRTNHRRLATAAIKDNANTTSSICTGSSQTYGCA
mmetsp:Transcript_38205/g.92168  ORF Transcript_38205/g.92168 Transcript_38205/m.92168 type:complete len:181 (+) Transcript_38205:923-1465(+)